MDRDIVLNTRTTLANWAERALIAPHHVNYHLEHHLYMTAPHFHLPKLYAIFSESGGYREAFINKGYWSVLRDITREEKPSV
jgi:fatty acid desaturase